MTLTILTAAVATILYAGAIAHAAPQAVAGEITIVLVHGAFAESSSWNGVIPRLLAKDHNVIAVANPLRGLRTDSDYVATVLDNIKGPVVLVGHSYGGSVISNAAYGKRNVKALVYIDGTAPDAGESAADLSGKFPGGTLGPALAPPVLLADGNKDIYIQRERYRAQFAADVPDADAKLMFATQRPVTEAALHEPSGSPAWKTIPSFFIYGALDLNIPPAAHAFMAKRAGAIETIEVKGASHVVMVSHPEEVAQLIDRAAKSPWKASPASATPASPVSPTANATPEAAGFNPVPVVALSAQPPARLIVDAPLPAQLATGYVVIRYRAENLRIMPVYGPYALQILPRIGHLHITVDDLPWHWLDASGEPLSINGLAPGPHTVLFELESPTHKVIDSKTIEFEIPQRK
ncbi:MAG: alpha/beta hydrolase [Anaerolineae bacterium]|nr:alpha/beta hydrolase [Phycisphaerae bacterium]